MQPTEEWSDEISLEELVDTIVSQIVKEPPLPTEIFFQDQLHGDAPVTVERAEKIVAALLERGWRLVRTPDRDDPKDGYAYMAEPIVREPAAAAAAL